MLLTQSFFAEISLLKSPAPHALKERIRPLLIVVPDLWHIITEISQILLHFTIPPRDRGWTPSAQCQGDDITGNTIFTLLSVTANSSEGKLRMGTSTTALPN